MSHQVAHHMHVDVSRVSNGPGIIMAPIKFDGVEKLTFEAGGVVELVHQGTIHRFDFHDIDDITVLFSVTEVVFTIVGNA